MDIKDVSEGFAVAPQMLESDMVALADRGFTTIICNRPDGEEAHQPLVNDMREAAQSAGLAFHHIPVSGGEFPAGAIAAFRAVRRGAEGKVLGYCRTGTRSITLEVLANPAGYDAETRIRQASAAGYDLSALKGRLG